MSVYKRFSGKRINSRDKNWSKGTWYIYKRLNGRVIHRSIPEAQTKDDAEKAERKIIESAFNHRYGILDTNTTFADFADGPYTRYVEQHNINQGAKKGIKYFDTPKVRMGHYDRQAGTKRA